jgi:hypothetical protein
MPWTEAQWTKFWQWATGILTVLVLAAGIYTIVDQRSNTDRVVAAVAAQKNAEQQRDEAREQLAKERAEKAQIAKISVDRVLYDYNRYLMDVKDAATAYDAAMRLPATAEGAAGRKAAAERTLYNAVDAFTGFVKMWRDVADALGKLLDGNVDRMDQARQSGRPNDVKDALDVLIRTFPSLRQALETQLEKIKNG